MLAALLAVSVALGQDDEPVVLDPGVVPAAGIATEGGPATLYVNPSSLAYDPDPSWGVFFRYDPDGAYRTSGAVVGHVSGVGAGLRWLHDIDRGSDFSVDLAAGVRLPKRVAIGGALRWNILAQTQNFVAFDAAASWRPLPWFGLSAITRNIGNPGGEGFAQPQTGVGIALRPVGRVLLLGADYVHTFADDVPRDVFSFTARVRPTSGLFLRAALDSELRFGAGVEVYFGGTGVGLYAGSRDAAGVPEFVGWVGTDERDENIAPHRRQVSVLSLEETPEYLPPRRLLERDDPSWLDTLDHFRRAAASKHVRGMLLTLGDVELSWAQWTELRDEIRRLRVAGKDVTVLLTGSPGNGAVYAGSAASRLLLHPAASVELTGVSAERVHLRGLLDAVGIDVQVVRRSGYKTAAESYTSTEISPEEREQTEALLDDLYEELVQALANGRTRTVEDVRRWIDGGPWSAEEAVALGIVDDRAYPDQARALLQTLHGDRVKLVDLGRRPEPRSAWEAPAQVAVIYVEGTIVRGESSPGGLFSGRAAGSATITEQLEAAGRNASIRAVVLRVDSPGGSAVASDEIWRAVELVQAAGKPVVVSMGGMAASGGYYVAAGADAIWAEPTTITGSIGVIGVKASVGPLLDRAGVGVTQITRGRNAGMDSPLLRWDPMQQARAQALVDATYATFKERVAHGRKLAPAQVEAVAQGRVWSGRDALEVGLVDALGGLQDAVRDAAHRAGIPERRPIEVVGLRQRVPLVERLLPSFDGLGTRLALGRIDRALARLEREGLRSGPLFEPFRTALLVGGNDETVWMIDPALVPVVTR